MTKKRVKRYPKAFRQMALERMRSCENVSAFKRELVRESVARAAENRGVADRVQ
jgi:hypothetical protein